MSFQPDNTESPFLATATSFPENGTDLTDVLAQNYQRSATAINSREIALYQNFESPTGQQWPTLSYLGGIPYAFNMSFRILVNVPPVILGINLIPHNIQNVTATFVFTKLFGGFGNGILWAAIPNDNVNLEVDALNARLTVPAAYVGFSGYIILEYLKTT